MTAHILINGVLYRAPEQRIAKSGKPFWTATIRVKDGDASQWWKILCFSESAGAELMHLCDGDAVSAQGSLKVEPYEKNGETRISMTCFADRILPLKPAPREKRPKADKPHASWAAPDRLRDDRQGVDGDLNDDIGF